MIMGTVTTLGQTIEPQLPNEYSGAKWYAVYTCARHEKRVAQQMDLRSLRGFVPLYRATHRWKDRRKEVELALFPSYVFVHLALKDRLRVLEIPGVVNIVGSQGKPTPLAEEEIERFRRGAQGGYGWSRTPTCRSAVACACAGGPWPAWKAF